MPIPPHLAGLLPHCIDSPDYNCATESQMLAFERTHAVRLPLDLRDWLAKYNGVSLGGLPFFGIGTTHDFNEIAYIYSFAPHWKPKAYIPFASDGCGDYYILFDSGDRDIVGFINPYRDLVEPDYVIASGLWKFLERVCLETLGNARPKTKEDILEFDPELAEVHGFRKQWEATD